MWKIFTFLLLFCVVTTFAYPSIQPGAPVLDRLNRAADRYENGRKAKNDSAKPKRIERSFDDEITDKMEQFDRKNEAESTTNVFWLPSPFIYPTWLRSSNQSFWQLSEKYLKRSENSDSTLTEQKDNKETWNNDKLYIEEGAKMIKTCAEQIDEMLLLIQNALGQFRKYLNEWCRNHHSMVKLSPESSDTFYLPKN
ncbi:uncharacterized protein LOC122633813 isoform X1 [Vespula pensylvanica]|uniref:uncharacterized protein LOC122633813 isoform X1 n=1 Tax=Vespula pensylvanica TaxID=30213 RepID=UPI001CBA001B|nr:uncharacterized protein LOC122633813 isoform X1 [Vespula pensylvanica]